MIGRLRYKLVIEGFPYIFVSDSSLEDTNPHSDQRDYIDGLIVDGAVISESINLRDCWPEVSDITVKLALTDEIGLKMFAYRPDSINWLSQNLSDDGTTMYPNKTDGGGDVNDYIYVGTEVMKITAVDGSTKTVTRQQWDTQAQAHYASIADSYRETYIYMAYDSSAQTYYPPPALANRRCYLYQYRDGESPDGDTVNEGTSDRCVYRGVISQEPTLNDDCATWSLNIAPVTQLFEQEIAKALDGQTWGIRGIYLHDQNALCFIIRDQDAAAEADKERFVKIVGYFEDDNAVLSELITTAILGFDMAARDDYTTIQIGNDNIITINTRTDSLSAGVYPHYTCALISSFYGCIRYYRDSWLSDDAGVLAGFPFSGDDSPFAMVEEESYYKKSSLEDGQYCFRPKVANRCVFPPGPKSWLGSVESLYDGPGTQYATVLDADPQYDANTSAGNNPTNRIYVESGISGYITSSDSLALATDGMEEIVVSIMSIHTSPSFYIDVGEPSVKQTHYNTPGGLRQTIANIINTAASAINEITALPYPLDATTKISVVKRYAEDANVSDFIEGLIDESIYANNGTTPFITDQDVHTISIATVIALRTYGLETLNNREYTFRDAISIRDVLIEEFKLAGVFGHLNSDGQFTISTLNIPTNTQKGLTSINTDHIVTPYDSVGFWPRWIPNQEGIINQIEYSPEYAGGAPITVINHNSISVQKNRGRGTMEIAPRSVSPAPNSDDIAKSMYRLLDFYSEDYDIIEIPASLDLMTTVVCGSGVRVTCPQIPDTENGTRGITAVPGLVIGREWPLDGLTAHGKLRIRLDKGKPKGGYAPSLYMESAAKISTTVWDLTVTAQKYAPSGEYDLDYFEEDYKILYYPIGELSGQLGTVTSITLPDTVRITFDAAPPWGASYNGENGFVFFTPYDGDSNPSYEPEPEQQEYVYIADSDGDLTGGIYNRGFKMQ